MDKLSKFCKNPTKQNFVELEEITQVLLNAASEYYVKKEKGDLEKARKIQMYYAMNTIPENILRGVRSIFLAMKMLALQEFLEIADEKYPVVNVYLEGFEKKAFQIRYETRKLDGMFVITQTNDVLGVDKELTMYDGESRFYFANIFAKDPVEVSKIDIRLSKDIPTRQFYRKNIGIIWSNEKCLECLKLRDKGAKLNSECLKLIEANCREKIRYSPNKKEKQVSKKVIVNKSLSEFSTKNNKECSVCNLMNQPNAKECVACETKF